MLVVVSPSVIGYYFMRIGFQLTFLPLLANTLVNDYVKVQSRGVATGIQNFGLTFGNLISVGGLFTLTKKWNNGYLTAGLFSGL